jgi:hypothetical protein
VGVPGLARRLGTGDAVVIGSGSMIGAGVFAAFGPAARAAGTVFWWVCWLRRWSPIATRWPPRSWRLPIPPQGAPTFTDASGSRVWS